MSTSVLIIGESGTGKSTSVRTLDPRGTYIINIIDKPLPFKGWKKSYKVDKEGKTTNYCAPPNYMSIIACLDAINTNRKNIKTVHQNSNN
jgi:ABC-type polar amino acid transport system ATPase subunit